MEKKIAVIARDRQGEAFRMALGLILLDDITEVYVLDRKVEATEGNMHNLEVMKDMDINVYTNFKENEDFEYLTTNEIAKRILNCDNILPY